MSTFRDVARNALINNGYRQYERQAEPVFRAIAAREELVVQRLINAATSRGLNVRDARALVRNAGLHCLEPIPPAPARQVVAATGEQVTVDTGTLNRLLEFARQNGFEG